MPGTSPEGWPYILDDDHPIEYPAYSQSLATLMDSRWDTYQATTTLAPFTGWADYGSGYALHMTRHADMVTIQAALKPTADATISATPVQIATIPAGWRPVGSIAAVAVYYTGSAVGFMRLLLDGTGMVRVTAPTSVTITTAGYIGFAITFRRNLT